VHAAKEEGKLDGWHIADQSYPKIMVNVSGQAMESAYLGTPGNLVEADELIVHPGDGNNGNGGAFNGLTLVGDVRKLSGMRIIIR
jgi:hypothetical protein